MTMSSHSIYAKLQFYLERRIASFLLVLLTIISLLIVFKASNEPIVGFLEGTFMETIFKRFSYGNDFVYNSAMGFWVSVIFYFIVVYLPERRRQMDIEPFIESKCEGIIFSSFALINEILKKSNLNYQYRTLTADQFKEVCENVNPKEHKYNFATSITKSSQNHLGYKIYNDWTRIVKEIDEIIRMFPNVDSGLLKEIYLLYNNFLKYTAKDLAEVENVKNDNLKAWSTELYDFYTATKSMRNYYRLYSGKDFKNDPWASK